MNDRQLSDGSDSGVMSALAAKADGTARSERYFGSSAKSTWTATELLVCPGITKAAELSLACSAMMGRGGAAATAPGR